MTELKELKELAKKAKSDIEFYRETYGEVNIENIESIEQFREKIPTNSKEKMLEFYDEGSFDLQSENIEDPLLGRPTSGTTNEMACYYRTKEEIDSHVERFWRSASHFFETGENKDRVMVATTFSLAPILTRQFLENGLMVTSGSPFDIDRTVETIRKMRINTLVCSPPVALKISEKLSEKGYEGLEKYYFVSSGLSELTKSKFQELYPEADIMLQYGLAETGILMEQCKHQKNTNKYHKHDKSPFNYEFVDEQGHDIEEGEVGEIIVTKFSEKTPLIRYQVGDLFEKQGKCSCGKTKYKFIGRKEDKFKLKGVTIFNDKIEEALAPVDEHIKQYQVIIDEEEAELPKPKIYIRAELVEDKEEIRTLIAETFSEEFQVADDYSWKKGVEMDLFAPVEVEYKEFEKRKFRNVKDERY